MTRDEEIRYWRKLFHAANAAYEEWKWRQTLTCVVLVFSVLMNAYFLFH